MAKYGNWFENAETVLDKTQNINADGDAFTGDVTGQVFGTTTIYAADGAIALTDTVAKLNSATATADMTLAAGTSGQKISVCAVLVTNSMTVTADFGGAITTATFSAAGESMEVVSDGTAWYVVGNNGVVLS